MGTLYEAKLGSPVGYLARELPASPLAAHYLEAIIDGTGILPAGPNIATIGDETSTEIILYDSITENSPLPGQTTVTINAIGRGFYGSTVALWPSLTPISRKYTSYDHDTMVDRVNALTRSATILVVGDNASENYINAADFVCDSGEEAHNITIMRAIDALTPGRLWAETVKLVGEFSPEDTITLPSNINLDLSEAILYWGKSDPLFMASGSFFQDGGVDKVYPLLSATSLGSSKVHINQGDIVDFAVDDYTLIYNDKTLFGDMQYLEGEIHQIYAIEEADPDSPVPPKYLKYSSNMWYDYPITGGVASSIKKVLMQKNIHIIGGEITLADVEDVEYGCVAIQFDKVAEFSIDGVFINNIPHAGIVIRDCKNGHITGYNIYGCTHEAGIGEDSGSAIKIIGATSSVSINGGISQRCAHHILSYSGDGAGSPCWCTYMDNNLRGGIGTNPAICANKSRSVGFRYGNNTVAGVPGDVYRIASSEWMASGDNIDADGIAYNINDVSNLDVSISNAYISRCDYAIKGDTLVDAISIDISGIDIKWNATGAIWLDFTDNDGSDLSAAIVNIKDVITVSGSEVTGVDTIYVCNAEIVNISRAIVALSNMTGIKTPYCRMGMIRDCISNSNNISKNMGGTDRGAGIDISLSTNMSVLNNQCCDDQDEPTQECGIYVGDVLGENHGNVVIGNIVSNNVNASQIMGHIGTTDTIVAENVGHKTESTGTATVVYNQTEVTVTHGLVADPAYVQISSGSPWGSATSAYTVINAGAGTFKIVLNTTPFPAGSAVNNMTFYWRAKVGQ